MNNIPRRIKDPLTVGCVLELTASLEDISIIHNLIAIFVVVNLRINSLELLESSSKEYI